MRSTSQRAASRASASPTKADDRNSPGSGGVTPTLTTSSIPASATVGSGCTSTMQSASLSSASPTATLVSPGWPSRSKKVSMRGWRRSRSTRITWRPDRARITARFATVVDLPSPSRVLVTTIEPTSCWSWLMSRLVLRIRNASALAPAGSARVTSVSLPRAGRGPAWAHGPSSGSPSRPRSSSAERTRVSNASRRNASPMPERDPDQDPEGDVAARFRLHLRRAAGRADHDRARAGRGERLHRLEVAGGARTADGRAAIRCSPAAASAASRRRTSTIALESTPVSRRRR